MPISDIEKYCPSNLCWFGLNFLFLDEYLNFTTGEIMSSLLSNLQKHYVVVRSLSCMKENGDKATEMKLLRLKKIGEYSETDVNILGCVSERKLA